MSYFIELLYNNNTKNFIDYKLDKDKITEKYKKDNNISSIWAINFMPEGNDLILNQYLTEKSVKLDIKKPKYKDWSFKNEFLKSYQYVIKNSKIHKTIKAENAFCKRCKDSYKELNNEFYIVYAKEYGNFCWGKLMFHLISEHNYKPPRFFIEYIYHTYYQLLYGSHMEIVKLDEHTLQHFETMSITCNEEKINYDLTNKVPDYNGNDYNIMYCGDIISSCNYVNSPTTKNRIRNMGIFFESFKVHDSKKILFIGMENSFDPLYVNYLFIIHPYNFQEKTKIDYYKTFNIDIPYYDDYIMFLSGVSSFRNLLQLIIFANEGIYTIASKIKGQPIDMSLFKRTEYEKISSDQTEFLTFLEEKKEEESLKKKYRIYGARANDYIKEYIYYQFLLKSPWVQKINNILEPCNLEVTYFPKVKIYKHNNLFIKNNIAYDTIYLPNINCFS